MIVLLVFVLAVSVSGQTVTFTIGEWAPFTGEDLADQGLAAAVVKAACSAAGLTYQISWAPWKRAEALVVRGQVFGSFPYLELVGRKAVLFSDTLFQSEFAVLASRENPATAALLTPPSSFARFRVGFTLGTEALSLALAKDGAMVEETVLIDQSIAKLKAGRLDFVIEDRNVLLSAIQRLGLDIKGFRLYEQRYGEPIDLKVMVSKSFPQAAVLLKKLNEGLRSIHADGTYGKILARYAPLR